jgi:hypothetical protein
MGKSHYQDRLKTGRFYLKLFLRGLGDPGKLMSRGWTYLRSRTAEGFIVSYPKTGRTWLRVMLGKAISLKYHLDEKFVLDTLRMTKQAGMSPSVFSHDGPFLLQNNVPYHELKFNRGLYGNKKVIFLVRDIRDTLVSSYFQQSKRTKVEKFNLGDFIRDERFGARKIVTFYNLWFTHREVPKDFLLIRYEEMHSKPTEVLRSVMAFLNSGEVEQVVLDAAVSYGSFNHMRNMEEKNAFGDSMLRPGTENDNDSYKVRRGKIGGFVDYFTKEDLGYVDEVVLKMGLKGCDWYYALEPH